jgi:Lrp/AsnC family leucine-responsive transcriptional regulator
MKTKPSGGRPLDRIDRKILRLLQQHGRMTMAELAEQVGLSASPCTERVRRLEREAVILGYHAHIHPHSLGQALLVFVEIRLSAKSGRIFEAFKREVLQIPHVLECHLVSGDFDYLIKARLPEMTAYRKLLGDKLLGLPGVCESRSYVVMEEIKESLAVPIPD